MTEEGSKGNCEGRKTTEERWEMMEEEMWIADDGGMKMMEEGREGNDGGSKMMEEEWEMTEERGIAYDRGREWMKFWGFGV